jgi:carbohydrate-selective porin OprB
MEAARGRDECTLPLRAHQLALFAAHVAQVWRTRGRTVRGIHRYRWAWSFSCALCWVGASVSVEPAHAQSVRADEPAPPGRTYATGDWGGYRSYLEDHGVTVTLSYTNDLLANVGGGIRPGQIDLGAFQPQLDIDLQKLADWQGGHIHVHGLVTHGPFFSQTYLGDILAVSNLEAGPVARLYALWYEQFIDRDISI